MDAKNILPYGCRVAPESPASELAARAAAGDLDAFEQLCRGIEGDLYAFLAAMLRNREDALDALQNCLVRIHRALPGLQDASRFRPWAFQIAANCGKTLAVRRSAHATASLDEPGYDGNNPVLPADPHAVSPRDAAAGRELAEDIAAAIEQLPPRQRAAIVMFETQGKSIREVAEALECSEGAVKFHLHEARKRLRLLLARHMPQGGVSHHG